MTRSTHQVCIRDREKRGCVASSLQSPHRIIIIFVSLASQDAAIFQQHKNIVIARSTATKQSPRFKNHTVQPLSIRAYPCSIQSTAEDREAFRAQRGCAASPEGKISLLESQHPCHCKARYVCRSNLPFQITTTFVIASVAEEFHY